MNAPTPDLTTLPVQHTPGPWLLDEDNLVCAGTTTIATVYFASDFPCLEADDDEDAKKLEAEFVANARLIAAAPDLLAALRAMDCIVDAAHDRAPLPFDDHRAWIAARAAIAKATGARA